MCVFAQPVRHVADTSIFARRDASRQFLVYGMHVATDADNAMVLPLPVLPSARERAVEFISLQSYPGFFTDLELLFPREAQADLFAGAAAAVAAPSIEVQRIGAFDASYVPSLHDFGRLDDRFRLPAEVWDALPGYHDYGFAVFKLRAGESKVHPMALVFESRERDSLFFPTVHVHEGRLDEWARFDHRLYLQGVAENNDWKSSSIAAGEVMSVGGMLQRDKTRGTVSPKRPVSCRVLSGTYENRDVRVKLQNWSSMPE